MSAQTVVLINKTNVNVSCNGVLVAPNKQSNAQTVPKGATSVVLLAQPVTPGIAFGKQSVPLASRVFKWSYAAPYSGLQFATVSIRTVIVSKQPTVTTLTVTPAANVSWVGVTPALPSTGVLRNQPQLPLVPLAPFGVQSKNTTSKKPCVASWDCSTTSTMPMWSDSPDQPFVQLVLRQSDGAYVLQHLTPSVSNSSPPVASYYGVQSGVQSAYTTLPVTVLACTPFISEALPVTVLADAAGQANGSGGVVLVFKYGNVAWLLDSASMCAGPGPNSLQLTQSFSTDVTTLPGFALGPKNVSAAEAVYLQLPPQSTLPARIADGTLDCCGDVDVACKPTSSTCTLSQTATGAYLCASSPTCVTPAPGPSPSDNSGLSTGAIVGIAIGSAAVLVGIIVGAVYGSRRAKRSARRF